jgi:hypothetical protein
MLRFSWGAMVLIAITALPGCSTILNGTQQSVSVVTKSPALQEVVGAKCSLSNTKGEWFLVSPGSVMVHRGYGVLTINCDHPDWIGELEAKSTTKAAAFGNIIFGGGIGVTVDMVNGAAYDYPQLMTVAMKSKAAETAIAVPAAEPAQVATAVPLVTQSAPIIPALPAPAVESAAPVVLKPAAPSVATSAPMSRSAGTSSVLGAVGEDAHTVEHLAEVRVCSASPRSTLTGKGPGMATYTVACNSGEIIAIRCDMGNCRVLR